MTYLSRFLFLTSMSCSFLTMALAMEGDRDITEVFKLNEQKDHGDPLTLLNAMFQEQAQVLDYKLIADLATKLELESLCSPEGIRFIEALQNSNNEFLKKQVEDRIDILCITYDCYQQNQFKHRALREKFQKLMGLSINLEPEEKNFPTLDEQKTNIEAMAYVNLGPEEKDLPAPGEQDKKKIEMPHKKNAQLGSSRKFLKFGFLSLFLTGCVYYFGYYKNSTRHKTA